MTSNEILMQCIEELTSALKHYGDRPRNYIAQDALLSVSNILRDHPTLSQPPKFTIGKYSITQNEHGVWFTRDCGESMQVHELHFDEFWKEYF